MHMYFSMDAIWSMSMYVVYGYEYQLVRCGCMCDLDIHGSVVAMTTHAYH